MNAVQYIRQNRPLSYEQQTAAKTLGRPMPDLVITKTVNGKTRDFNRYFRKDKTYGTYSWMCGCPVSNKLFCFVCLVSNDLKSTPWTEQGVDDLQHLKVRATNHEKSFNHLHYVIDYNLIGCTDIHKQLNSAYVINMRAHNAQVDKNRHILRRLIMCVKFCGAFELALPLRGQEEEVESQNPGIFHGLVDFAAELDSALSHHLKEATVFQGSSKTIQNELLDAMFHVCRNEILEQITKTNFVAVVADETTDSFNQQQLAIVLRYVFQGEIIERFWGFIRPSGNTAESIAGAIMKEIAFLGIPANKLIAQSYDGTSVMSGKNGGVQSIIRQKYPDAYFIHCYAHQFTLFLEKAASYNKKLKLFFAAIHSFGTFFSKRTAALDEILRKRLPMAAPIPWNFKTRTIKILYKLKELIHECLEEILDGVNDSKTIIEADGLLRILNSNDFNYFLEGLFYIAPHVEKFFKQVQSREANSLYVQTCLKNFQSEIIQIRETKIDFLSEETAIDPLSENTDNDTKPSTSKRPRTDDTSKNNTIILKEYYDVLLNQIKDRYDFTGHLSAASLFLPDLIPTYKNDFPEETFNNTVEAYPFIDEEKLHTELSVIYSRNDMRYEGVLPLLTFISKNNLQEGFSETCKLLEIICTTPMMTSESERCFSTLQRIKCFLRVTVAQERLNALAMLAVDKKLAQSIDDFDNKVVSVFANSNNRNMDFNYK